MLSITIRINEVAIPEPLQGETPSDRYYNVTATLDGYNSKDERQYDFESFDTWKLSEVEFAVAKSLEKFINKSVGSK